MKKIPTLFRRDPDDLSRVLSEVAPGCEWVLAGEGVPTLKYDGTCMMLDGDGRWWARREVKPGKQPPAGWVEVDADNTTMKRVGWEPAEQSGFAKFLAEALSHSDPAALYAGTFELCGPKVNGNREGLIRHELIRHGCHDLGPLTPRTVEGIREYVVQLGEVGAEGVVWHHPDGRMVKLKARDFARVDA